MHRGPRQYLGGHEQQDGFSGRVDLRQQGEAHGRSQEADGLHHLKKTAQRRDRQSKTTDPFWISCGRFSAGEKQKDAIKSRAQALQAFSSGLLLEKEARRQTSIRLGPRLTLRTVVTSQPLQMSVSAIQPAPLEATAMVSQGRTAKSPDSVRLNPSTCGYTCRERKRERQEGNSRLMTWRGCQHTVPADPRQGQGTLVALAPSMRHENRRASYSIGAKEAFPISISCRSILLQTERQGRLTSW